MKTVSLVMLAIPMLSGCYDFSEQDISPPAPPDLEALWIWVGPEQGAPACPYDRLPLWEGSVGEASSPVCGECTCSRAACQRPSLVTTHAGICADGGGAVSSFDAGEGWDGSCAAPGPPVPNEAFSSVTYEPPTLAPCAPSPTPSPLPIAGGFVRACPVTSLNGNFNAYKTCWPPEEDGQCWGDPSLHLREFTTMLVDHRTCTPCECGAPTGGSCVAQVTLYQDTGCTAALDMSVVTDTDEPLCTDVTSGPLAAMRAELTQAKQGACTPSVSKVRGTVERGPSEKVCCPW